MLTLSTVVLAMTMAAVAYQVNIRWGDYPSHHTDYAYINCIHEDFDM